jgi:hypothetical protein
MYTRAVIRALPSIIVVALGLASVRPAAAQDVDGAEPGDVSEDGVLVIRPTEEMSDEEYLRARGRHCAGRYREQVVLSQLFALQVNPEGVLNQFRLGLCFPLIRNPGVLFDYTSVEIGVLNELTPAFTHLGGYAQISPLSFLVFRAELSGLVIWPLPANRAGYYPVDNGYDSPYDGDDLPAGEGVTETGWNLNLITILRGKVVFTEVWGLILLSILSVGYWDVGEDVHYFNLRWDVILNGKDWVIANEAFLGVEQRINPDFGIRYGLFDSYRRVPNAGYEGHQLGIFFMGWWPKPHEAVWDLTPFVRAGYYLDHAFRADGAGEFSVTAGLMTQYELGGL